MDIVTSHKNTDFDGFASMIGATLLYPGVVPMVPKMVNQNVKAFLSIHKDVFHTISREETDIQKIRRLIVVDTNSWGRLDQLDGIKNKKNLEIILWDHHNDAGDIIPGWKCQENVGATVTLLVMELKKRCIELTPIHATLFLTGIYEDTGNLMFPSTKSKDAEAVAYLLNQKADLNIVNTILRPPYGEKQKNILFEMLKSDDTVKLNGFRISFNVHYISGHINNLALVVHMYREILNADAAFGIFPIKESDKCMVIGRSNHEAINVGTIMRSIGGGGHPRAGSALLKSVNPNAIREMITELILGNQRTSVQISDLMSFPVVTVSSTSTMETVAKILREKGFTGLPVVDDGKIVGVISRRDFKKIRKESQLASPVKAFMNSNVITIAPGTNPVEAARLMVKYDIGRLPVVDNNDRLIGIITRSDAMHYFYDILPD